MTPPVYILNARQQRHATQLAQSVQLATITLNAARQAQQSFLLALQDTLDLDDMQDWTVTQIGDTLTFAPSSTGSDAPAPSLSPSSPVAAVGPDATSEGSPSP